jgi:hypothetical protein
VRDQYRADHRYAEEAQHLRGGNSHKLFLNDRLFYEG